MAQEGSLQLPDGGAKISARIAVLADRLRLLSSQSESIHEGDSEADSVLKPIPRVAKEDMGHSQQVNMKSGSGKRITGATLAEERAMGAAMAGDTTSTTASEVGGGACKESPGTADAGTDGGVMAAEVGGTGMHEGEGMGTSNDATYGAPASNAMSSVGGKEGSRSKQGERGATETDARASTSGGSGGGGSLRSEGGAHVRTRRGQAHSTHGPELGEMMTGGRDPRASESGSACGGVRVNSSSVPASGSHGPSGRFARLLSSSACASTSASAALRRRWALMQAIEESVALPEVQVQERGRGGEGGEELGRAEEGASQGGARASHVSLSFGSSGCMRSGDRGGASVSYTSEMSDSVREALAAAGVRVSAGGRAVAGAGERFFVGADGRVCRVRGCALQKLGSERRIEREAVEAARERARQWATRELERVTESMRDVVTLSDKEEGTPGQSEEKMRMSASTGTPSIAHGVVAKEPGATSGSNSSSSSSGAASGRFARMIAVVEAADLMAARRMHLKVRERRNGREGARAECHTQQHLWGTVSASHASTVLAS